MTWLINVILALLGRVIPATRIEEIIRDLLGLFAPDWTDEGAVRAWLQAAAKYAGWLAGLTPTAVDDRAVEALKLILENDERWAVLWQLVSRIVIGQVVFRSNGKLTALGSAWAGKLADASPGMSWAEILAVIRLVIEILERFRK